MNWLYSRGWTVRQAARRLNCSYSHLAYVLRGKRVSASLAAKVRKLPQRALHMRETAAR